MRQIFSIISKDILQWTRRPLYFISSVALAVLIITVVGNAISGANDIPFGLHDPAGLSDLKKRLTATNRFHVIEYDNLDRAKADLKSNKIIALADVSQDPLEDSIQILMEGHNPLIQNQISMGLITALTDKSSTLDLPIHTDYLFPTHISIRDFVTPGLVAYLCYVLAGMNLGFSWIYEWMEKTYRLIILAPNGLRSVVIAKTFTVTVESSFVLLLALCLTAPIVGFTLGHNVLGLIGFTLLSSFTYTCLGLTAACLLKTIRVYAMTVSILGVALMFLSGVMIPVEAMPPFEKTIAYIFPMFYSADAFKGIMLNMPASYERDILVLLAWSLFGLATSIALLVRRKMIY